METTRRLLELEDQEILYVTLDSLLADVEKHPWINSEPVLFDPMMHPNFLSVQRYLEGYRLTNYYRTLCHNKIALTFDLENDPSKYWIRINEPDVLPDACLLLRKQVYQLKVGEEGYILPNAIIKEGTYFSIQPDATVELRGYPTAQSILRIKRLDEQHYCVRLCQYKTEQNFLKYYCERAEKENWPKKFIAILDKK